MLLAPLAGVAALVTFDPAILAQEAELPPVAGLMDELYAEYGAKDSKYESLAKKIDKEAAKRLAALGEQPWKTLVDELAEAAREGAVRKKNSAAVAGLLERFPWNTELELVLGLQFGSDRPVPQHENGFIALGSAPEGFPGYPDLLPNEYLWGLDEIVGWQNAVGLKQGPDFAGRGPKDASSSATEMPAGEAVRVLLQGSLPEVPLFAIPELTRRIHVRLAERRRSESGEPAAMDLLLAFLDSKWNGFTFQAPYAEDSFAIVRPVHALYTENNGFLGHFPTAQQHAESGDMPFVAVQTYAQYASTFLGEQKTAEDFVEAPGGGDRWLAENNYLAGYKKLIDELVRALLAPNLPYPRYLAAYDYPEGRGPAARDAEGYDVPRSHAVLAWAHAGKDPAALADFLHDELLTQEANRFPSEQSPAIALTLLVREREQELLAGIAETIRAEREAHGGDPGPYEREFSPFPTYLDTTGPPATVHLVHSFQAFHEPATSAIRNAAYAVVLKELGR